MGGGFSLRAEKLAAWDPLVSLTINIVFFVVYRWFNIFVFIILHVAIQIFIVSHDLRIYTSEDLHFRGFTLQRIYTSEDLHFRGFTLQRIYTSEDLHFRGFTLQRIYTSEDLHFRGFTLQRIYTSYAEADGSMAAMTH